MNYLPFKKPQRRKKYRQNFPPPQRLTLPLAPQCQITNIPELPMQDVIEIFRDSWVVIEITKTESGKPTAGRVRDASRDLQTLQERYKSNALETIYCPP